MNDIGNILHKPTKPSRCPFCASNFSFDDNDTNWKCRICGCKIKKVIVAQFEYKLQQIQNYSQNELFDDSSTDKSDASSLAIVVNGSKEKKGKIPLTDKQAFIQKIYGNEFYKNANYKKVKTAYDLCNERNAEVFISYSNTDSKYVKEFLKIATPLSEDQNIILWHYDSLKSGNWIKSEIGIHLRKAKSVVLFVSKDFIVSDFIKNVELPIINEAFINGELNIHWMPVSDFLIELTQFDDLWSSIGGIKPLNKYRPRERDQLYIKTCREIMKDFSTH